MTAETVRSISADDGRRLNILSGLETLCLNGRAQFLWRRDGGPNSVVGFGDERASA
jgi:hypothetical protein